MRVRSLLSVSAAVLIGTLSVAPAAFAADADTAHLVALTAHDPTLNGTTYPVKPGETIPVTAGVANAGDEPVSGLVVHLWFIGSEQRLTDNFSNCQYYLDGTAQGAWCEFDQLLAAGGKYALPPLHVSVPQAAKETRTLVEQVFSKEYVDSRGGIAAVAKTYGENGTLVTGTGSAASLVEGTDLTPAKRPGPTSFIYFNLTLPSASPSASTSASPSPSATATATATAAAGGEDGGTGGGLPVTGTDTAVLAGIGAALLAAGAALFLLTRRRRASFTA